MLCCFHFVLNIKGRPVSLCPPVCVQSLPLSFSVTIVRIAVSPENAHTTGDRFDPSGVVRPKEAVSYHAEREALC